MKRACHPVLALLLASLAGCATGSPRVPAGSDPPAEWKPRVIVTTDPELDDSNSLVRYLLHATDFRTEGLVYASSQFHWKGDGKGTRLLVPGREYTRFGLSICPCESWRWAEGERFIDDAVDVYERVYPNLRAHHPDYPSPAELKGKIRVGNVEFDGDISADSPGSDLIRSVLLDAEEGPVHLLAWGGLSTIARALKSIEEQHSGTPQWPAVQRRVSRKAIIHAFGDQDDTYARYIRPSWPEVELREMATQTYGYGARNAVLPEDQALLGAAWMEDNVSSLGPFGAFYRVWGDGKQMVRGDVFDYFGFSGLGPDELRSRGYVVWMAPQEQGSWISEGDTPTFLNLVDNGLRAAEDATFGGWGGRRGTDVGPNGPHPQYASARFFGAAQRELAARLRWSVTPAYAAANHPPSVSLRSALDHFARPGEAVRVEGRVSDPDGDAVTTRWWRHTDADSYTGPVALSDTAALATTFRVPEDAPVGSAIHLILEATDDGVPALTRYRRVVVRVSR